MLLAIPYSCPLTHDYRSADSVRIALKRTSRMIAGVQTSGRYVWPNGPRNSGLKSAPRQVCVSRVQPSARRTVSPALPRCKLGGILNKLALRSIDLGRPGN